MVKILQLPRVVECRILRRETLFTVLVNIENSIHRALLRNTGRLAGLLNKGAKAFCIPKSTGKTRYILLCVEVKRGLYSILDTSLHMKIFEKLAHKDTFPWMKNWTIVKRNPRAYESILDYLIKSSDFIGFIELKSAVHSNGVYAMYPDAPSPRGIRHLYTLIRLRKMGYRSVVVFAASFPGVRAFRPFIEISPEYGRLLRSALSQGVEAYAFNVVMNRKGDILLEKSHLPLELPL
ncbi:MAG: DNA/RNA nuclease SfsA [Thermoprotei archaeon]|nr:MAG: DNA/RNA nuclease SfsA [Thermoprotei archaeon]RLF01172.1 MAG: DNA/RNA nuclease SfsA [Thermoprotei archaeon]HDI74369.1 DNA/RNA nuclease SfsA [Thermoprotei archaeon]